MKRTTSRRPTATNAAGQRGGTGFLPPLPDDRHHEPHEERPAEDEGAGEPVDQRDGDADEHHERCERTREDEPVVPLEEGQLEPPEDPERERHDHDREDEIPPQLRLGAGAS